MQYDEAIRYIHSTCWKGSRPGLSRITELLRKLGNPEKDLRVIHVAGTNGKGSLCAMLESVLTSAGYRVGLFTSPYIEEFTERIRVGGKNIPKQDLAEVTEFVRPFAEEMEDTPTEFELITAIGILYFARAGVDLAVLECGMGGRLDSTNVINAPLLSVITGIALDHTEYLGDTVEKIAAEKAGIIKSGCPVLFGGEDPHAAEVIREKAVQMGSPFTQTVRKEIKNVRCSLSGTVFDYPEYPDLRLSLLGSYQPYNAANLVEAVKLLRWRGLTVSDGALRKGLEDARWKGRFERMNESPAVFFDGGHNYEGVTAAAETVKLLFGDRKLLLLTGMMADKEYEKMAAVMAGFAKRVYTVTPDNPRALPAEKLASVFRAGGVSAESFASYEDAVAAAFRAAKAEDVPLLALGSLYSYASFKPALQGLLEKEKEGIR